MKPLLYKIYTILKLITNVIIKRKYYKLSFFAEENYNIKRWYYDFKYWGFNKENLEMVAGADKLCELYAKGKNYLTVEIIATKKPLNNDNIINNYDMFIGEIFPKNTSMKDKLMWGRTYNKIITENGEPKIIKMWICPVTLFVLGRYPNYIYIKRK